MGKFESETTRKFLLNSNSRGSLNEVVREDEELELAAEEGVEEEMGLENRHFFSKWDGREETHAYFRHSYE